MVNTRQLTEENFVGGSPIRYQETPAKLKTPCAKRRDKIEASITDQNGSAGDRREGCPSGLVAALQRR
jgi:hypothetical protein